MTNLWHEAGNIKFDWSSMSKMHFLYTVCNVYLNFILTHVLLINIQTNTQLSQQIEFILEIKH